METNYKEGLETDFFCVYKRFINSSKDVVGCNTNKISYDDYQQLYSELECMKSTFELENEKWIKNAIRKLIKYTSSENNYYVKLAIIQSKAYDSLSLLKTQQLALGFMKITTNLTANSPMIVYKLLEMNFLTIIFNSAFNNFNDSTILSILNILNNIVNSSKYSRLYLMQNGFFSFVKKFVEHFNRSLNFIRKISNITSNLICLIVDPSLSFKEHNIFDDNKKIIDIFSEKNINSNIIYSIINFKINIKKDDEIWYIAVFFASYNDSNVKVNGIKLLYNFASNAENIENIFKLTYIFEMCKSFCERNNEDLQYYLFLLIGKIGYYLGIEANERFIKSDLLTYISQFFFSKNKLVSFAAMQCISNYLPFNTNEIPIIFNSDFLSSLLIMLKNGNYQEREEILWIIFNISKVDDTIIYKFLETNQNISLSLDFLETQSDEIVVLILSTLRDIIFSSDKYHDLFIQNDNYQVLKLL